MTLPSTLQVLGDGTFAECRELREVAFEKGSKLKRIGKRVFRECGSLKSICLPEGLETIELGCFSKSGLEEIAIPSSVATMKELVFSECKALRTVTFKEGNRLRTISEDCFEYSGLEEFTAPPGLREIGGRAFQECARLKRVVLNEGLETLDDCFDSYFDVYYGVFQYCGLEEVTLPSTLREIGAETFCGCDSLRTICVRSGCRADLSRVSKPELAKVCLLPD